MSHKSFRNLQDAVEYLMTLSDSEAEDVLEDGVDLCQLPPDEDDRLTDEEDINDNMLDEVIPTEICGQIDMHIGSTASSKTTVCEEHAIPSTSKNLAQTEAGDVMNAKKKRKLRQSSDLHWRKSTILEKTIQSSEAQLLANTYPELTTSSPIDLFWKIFPESYFDHLAHMTSLYARYKNRTIDVSWEDIAQFCGILVLSGYHHVPTEDMYWSTSEDVAVQIVPKVMSRNRFRDLKKNFHVVDNMKLIQGDKLGKIRPLYDELNKNLQQFGIFHGRLSIDESMVPYYGCHSCKMYIKGKPIRFGYKIWMLCSSCGFPYAMEIYSGKKDNLEQVPLGTRVVKDLLSIVQEPEKVEIFFDNFFTSYNLLKQLAEKNIKATGTVREGRIEHCPLKSVKEMKKEKRGNFDFQSDGVVYVCRWHDNSIVTLASNYLTHEPVGTTKRYSRAAGKKIEVTEPNVVGIYNAGMGGVDVFDKLLSSYRPKLRCKKWWWNLFSNGLNIAVTASWLLYRELHGSDEMDHLDFRREVAMALMRQRMRITSRPGPRTPIPASRRKADGHFLIQCDQGRCVHCGKNARLQCFECKKRIHIHCFPKYHGLDPM